ncbi:protein kinase [Streptomyces sp. NPDC040724]|uniref:protein kinase domain-containing protein n=1 Tax=Streptomyces sp. NPDC040724 TaxID=3155612 RepID=UPI0033DC34AF
MASVYRAHDSVLGRTVAVKMLHSELAHDPSFRERFRREAQAVAALNHANIVAVHDSGEDIGDGGVVQYIVMEYVQGRSLRQLIQDSAASPSPDNAMALERALAITAGVLDALTCSHRNGLVHRDIKPANVMVTDDGTVKVMDFGIARALQSDATAMTRTGTILGTPQYLSPEQALGKPADARSDLYSVGCMLFELITGKRAFDGESTMSVLYQHVQQPAPTPSSVNPSLPPAIDEIVARALSKDPAQRYPDAQAMAEAIRRPVTSRASTRQIPSHDALTLTITAPAPARATASTDAGAAPDRPRRPGRRDAPRRDPYVRQFAFIAVPIVLAVLVFNAAMNTGSPFSSSSDTPDPRATGDLFLCEWGKPDGKTRVPDFGHMSPEKAKTCAEIAGLKLVQKTKTGGKDDKDTVIKQEPESADYVEPGSTVTVWLSTGADPRATGDLSDCGSAEIRGKVAIPTLMGRTPAKARMCADIAQLKLEEAGSVPDALTPAGRIARQEPQIFGDRIPPGSTLRYWISTGRP